MQKIFFYITFSLAWLAFVPNLVQATTVSPKSVSTAKVAAKQTVAKKKTSVKIKKRVVRKVSTKFGSKATGFSASAAAGVVSADGKTPPPGYMEAIKKAETHCLAARGNAKKLEACDEEYAAAQAMLNQ